MSLLDKFIMFLAATKPGRSRYFLEHMLGLDFKPINKK